MTVVVAYKYAANPQDASVGSDGVVNWSRAKANVSEYDPVAIQLGRNLANATESQLVGVSVGGASIGSSMAKKNALSKGLDSAVILADDATTGWNATLTAAALVELVRTVENPQIVITGDSSIDDGSRITSALIAGYLGWPCFQEVLDVQRTQAGHAITQAVPGGVRTVEVTGPVVVAATSDAVEVKAASMKEILAAGKKPSTDATLADLTVPTVALEITARTKPADKDRKKQIFTGDDAAEQLVAALRADGVL